jgi:predicted RNase H-like nuclease (RuvC/YqgF family)
MLNLQVEQLQTNLTEQHKQIEMLTARLEEQSKQIQRLNAQVEVGKPAAKVVSNKP